MLRRMIYVPRHTTETPEEHMILWSKLLHICRRKHKNLHDDEMYFASYFSWCGHVTRLTKADTQRETSRIFTQKKGMVAEFEERARITNPWTQVQGVEMGAGRGTVFWHGLDERGTGSVGMEGQDGCNDQVKKTKDDGSKCQSHRMTIDPSTAFSSQNAA